MPDWDQHYTSMDIGKGRVTDVLSLNDHLLGHHGKALDYACGTAANGRWLEARGYDVRAWDNSKVVIDKLSAFSQQHDLRLMPELHDLEQMHPEQPNDFDLVVCSSFLHRPTIDMIPLLLKPGGLLFYQTFCGEQLEGRGPSNPTFRLKTGELLDMFSEMQILFYREDGVFGQGAKSMRDQALLVAAKI
ncbi:MAG: methyltransferase domain-containing protein [Gammaproteobacteria bacterium]